MAKSVGVDPGDTLVKVVELDGSYRKPRLLRVHTEPLGAGEPRAVAVDDEALSVVTDGGHAAIRRGPRRQRYGLALWLTFHLIKGARHIDDS